MCVCVFQRTHVNGIPVVEEKREGSLNLCGAKKRREKIKFLFTAKIKFLFTAKAGDRTIRTQTSVTRNDWQK